MMDERQKIPDLVRVKEDTPEDLKVAIETFFEATKMIKEFSRNIHSKTIMN